MHIVDSVVLVAYLLGITALGVWTARRVTSSSDFFMPRRFGKSMMIMHAFGTGTASDQAVSVAAATMRQGVSGIWYQWIWLITTPFYWLIAPIFRRFRAVTTADVYNLRYDRSVAMLFAVVGMGGMAVKIGVMLKGAGALVDAGTGGLLDANLAIACITVLFVVYGMAGGLGAAIVTDFVQGVLTLAFSFMLLPFVLNAVGGLDGVKETIAGAGLADQMLSLVAPGKVGLFFIVMMSIQILVGIVAFPSAMGISAAGKTEMEGRIGYTVGTYIKRICTVAWCLTALGAVAWYLTRGIELQSVNPDNVYGDVARAFLPGVLPGLLGLFLASLLAAVMSSCDSFMIAASGLFTQNIYQPWRPGRSSGHYVGVGRLTGLVIVVGGLTFAYWVSDVIKGVEIWFQINPMMGIAFWLGLLWRRMTTAGAWASTLAGFGTWWLATREFAVDWAARLPFAEPLRLVWVEQGTAAIYKPWEILAYMVAATSAGIVVSLFTRRVPKEKLDRYYALTRTPIQKGEVIETPCTFPPGVEPASREMLVTALGLEIPRPSTNAVLGFLGGCLAVVALIGGFVLLMRM
jgi:Na+/proline symporter